MGWNSDYGMEVPGRSSDCRGQAGDSPALRRATAVLGSLRFRLMLLAVLAMGPALAVVVHERLSERSEALEAADAEALATARAAARVAEGPFDDARRFLNAVAVLPEVRDLDLERCSAILPDLLSREPRWVDLGILGADGALLASGRPGARGLCPRNRSFFERALQTRRFAVGRASAGLAGAGPTVRVGHPMVDSAGGVKAVVFLAVDARAVEEGLLTVDLPAGAVVQVLDDAGAVVAGLPGPPKGVLGGPAVAARVGRVGSVAAEGAVEAVGEDGVARRFAFSPLRSGGEATGVTVAVGLPARAAAAAAESGMLRAGLLVAGLAAVALLGSWLLGGYLVTNRVDGLVRAATRLSRGGGQVRARPRPRAVGELGQIEGALDELALSLEVRNHELRQAEARHRLLVETIPAVLFVARDAPGAPAEYVSPQIGALTGYPPADWLARPGAWWDRVDPADRERVTRETAEARAAGRPHDVEYRLRAPDGAVVWVREHGLPAEPPGEDPPRIRGFLVDVTDRKLLERQFLQAQKLEAVGLLAAGVAHDFNNLLTVIAGYAAMLQTRAGADRALRDPADEIARAAERATALARQLLQVARRRPSEPSALDVTDCLRAMDRIVRRVIGDRIEVRMEIATGAGAVWMERAEFDQVVLNIVVNARDAMPEGGVLTIGAEPAPGAPGEEPAARRVCLWFRDTGSGMDAGTQARIFEPFFTTKAEGKGSGLGLSTAREIVRRARGRIEVESAPGRGTTFRIWLPRREDGAAGAAPSPAPADRAAGAVLVVAGEPSIRGFARHVAEEAGRPVVEAASAAEALRALSSSGVRVEIVITDAVLPDGDGPDLVRRVLAARPGLRAVLLEEQGPGERAAGPRREGGVLHLPKPFRPRDLRDALARLGNGSEGGAEAGT